MKTCIVVSMQIEGIHCWPECDVDSVAFLKHPHRHIFHIKIKKQVRHTDRQIEIIRMKRCATESLKMKYYNHDDGCCNFGRMSCEDIATLIFRDYNLDSCEVLEDGENGAEVSI